MMKARKAYDKEALTKAAQSPQELDDAEVVERAAADAEARYADIMAAAARDKEEQETLAETLDKNDFKVSALGGQWQVARAGRSVCDLRVDCKAKTDAFNLAAKFGLPRPASFECNKCSHGAAALLIDAYQHKMIFLARFQGNVLPAAKVSSYTLPDKLQRQLDGCSPAGRNLEARLGLR